MASCYRAQRCSPYTLLCRTRWLPLIAVAAIACASTHPFAFSALLRHELVSCRTSFRTRGLQERHHAAWAWILASRPAPMACAGTVRRAAQQEVLEGDEHWQSLLRAGNADMREGRLSLARSKYLDALMALRGSGTQRGSDGVALRMRLAAVHVELGRHEDALRDYKAVQRSLEAEGAHNSVEAAGMRMKTACLYDKMGQPKRAFRDYLAARRMLEGLGELGSKRGARLLSQLGSFLLRQGELKEALPQLEAAKVVFFGPGQLASYSVDAVSGLGVEAARLLIDLGRVHAGLSNSGLRSPNFGLQAVRAQAVEGSAADAAEQEPEEDVHATGSQEESSDASPETGHQTAAGERQLASSQLQDQASGQSDGDVRRARLVRPRYERQSENPVRGPELLWRHHKDSALAAFKVARQILEAQEAMTSSDGVALLLAIADLHASEGLWNDALSEYNLARGTMEAVAAGSSTPLKNPSLPDYAAGGARPNAQRGGSATKNQATP